MTKNIIIGYGNPILEDDGLGFEVVNQFNEKHSENEDVDCFHVQQLGLELLPYLELCETVVFIDASVKVPEGEISVEILTLGECMENPVSHFFDPQTLLSSLFALYQKHPKAVLITVGAKDFGIKEGLTDKIMATIPEVLDIISIHVFS